MVAVGHDQLARAGQLGQPVRAPIAGTGHIAWVRPTWSISVTAGVTGLGHRGRQRGVQLGPATGLQQQHRREQVPGGLGQGDPFADLLDEDVLVADDQPGLVGRVEI